MQKIKQKLQLSLTETHVFNQMHIHCIQAWIYTHTHGDTLMIRDPAELFNAWLRSQVKFQI